MTLFKDMPSGALRGWLAWCARHHWASYERAAWYDAETGELVTYTALYDTTLPDTSSEFYKPTIEEARHHTPRDLKAWAGY